MERENAVLATYTLSWVAYVRPLVVSVIMGLAGFWAAAIFENQWIAVVVVLLAIAWLVYQMLYIRSVRLYTDESGVWLSQGVFPWQTGFVGVKWRDVDGALFRKHFISWLCRSYVVQVGHRYTKDNELVVIHVGKGDRFVEHVNQEHQSRFHAFKDED